MIELGDLANLQITIKNAAGALADAGAVALTVTQPSGATLVSGTDFAIAHTVGTGVYTADVPTSQVGSHSYRWVATGANSGVHEDTYTVEAQGGLLVSTAEALAKMQAAAVITKTPDLENLRWLCRVATDSVERDLNRVLVRRAIVESRPAADRCLYLYRQPVVSVTSVTVDGVTAAPAGYRFRHGILESQYAWSTSGAWDSGLVVVTYVAGDSPAPVVARDVALAAVLRMWQHTAQMPHPALDDLGAEAVSVAAGSLNEFERRAYDSLRILDGIA